MLCIYLLVTDHCSVTFHPGATSSWLSSQIFKLIRAQLPHTTYAMDARTRAALSLRMLYSPRQQHPRVDVPEFKKVKITHAAALQADAPQ